MKTVNGYVDDAYMTWLTSAVKCCGPLRDQSPMRGLSEKPMTILHDSQPRLIPPPIFESQERPSSRSREWVDRTRSFASRASSRGSFSVRRRLGAYAGPRKDSKESRRTRTIGTIGLPSDFRRVENAMPRRTERFRPLELSIYMPRNQLSPILPHFANIDDLSFPNDPSTEPSYPSAALTHSRSESALSFSIPRKPIRSSSGMSSELSSQFRQKGSMNSESMLTALEKDLPQAPPAAILRAHTEPPAYERVKSAVYEKLVLEQRLRDIEAIIEERQSIYLSSRPTSRMSSNTHPITIYQETSEPMPEAPPILQPTLPPLIQPSFAERVATPPHTQLPKKTVHIPNRAKSFTEASSPFTIPTQSPPLLKSTTSYAQAQAPPPPLPLILQQARPPLRKKKSFSRVSNWLFPNSPDAKHERNMSLDSVTNTPKPVTLREGFYQCVITADADTVQPMTPRSRGRGNMSTSSIDTVSTLGSEIDEPTAPTTWTPDSSPGRGRKMEMRHPLRSSPSTIGSGRQEQSIELTRMRTFGEREETVGGLDEGWRMPHGRGSVGVAF